MRLRDAVVAPRNFFLHFFDATIHGFRGLDFAVLLGDHSEAQPNGGIGFRHFVRLHGLQQKFTGFCGLTLLRIKTGQSMENAESERLVRSLARCAASMLSCPTAWGRKRASHEYQFRSPGVALPRSIRPLRSSRSLAISPR